MSTISDLTAEWWSSLAQLKAEILAAKSNDLVIEAACLHERERAESLLSAIEDAGPMTPAEAAALLNLVLVQFAEDGHDDDLLYRLLTAIRDGLAPPS